MATSRKQPPRLLDDRLNTQAEGSTIVYHSDGACWLAVCQTYHFSLYSILTLLTVRVPAGLGKRQLNLRISNSILYTYVQD